MTTQQPEERDLTPRPNRILAEPATVEACRRDWDQGADVRQTLATQEARNH